MAGVYPIISLHRQGHLMEEAPVRGNRLYTGSSWKNQLTDPQSGMHHHRLFLRTVMGYRLYLPAETKGTFSRAGSSVSLDDMLAWGLASRSKKGIVLNLDRRTSGEFHFGGATYRLRFGPLPRKTAAAEPIPVGKVPVSCRLSPPDRTDLAFSGILLATLLCAVLTVQGLARVDIPDITTIRQLPRRISRLILEPVAPPPAVTTVTEKGPGDATAQEEETKPEPEEAAPEKTEEPRGPAADEGAPAPTREVIRRQVSKVGILGVLTGKGTAGRSSARRGITALQLDEELSQSLEDVLSEVGGITTAAEDAAGGGFGPGGEGKGLLGIEGQLGGTGVDSPIKISSLGELPTGPGSGGDRASEEVVRPEEHENRSTRAIARVVAAHTGAIRYAYNRELRKNPALRGKIVLTFTIAAAGNVTACRVEESAMDWPPLEEALVRMVRKWTFPEIPQGDVTVSYPLVFFPSM